VQSKKPGIEPGFLFYESKQALALMGKAPTAIISIAHIKNLAAPNP
jgi:hypothetical protein